MSHWLFGVQDSGFAIFGMLVPSRYIHGIVPAHSTPTNEILTHWPLRSIVVLGYSNEN